MSYLVLGTSLVLLAVLFRFRLRMSEQFGPLLACVGLGGVFGLACTLYPLSVLHFALLQVFLLSCLFFLNSYLCADSQNKLSFWIVAAVNVVSILLVVSLDSASQTPAAIAVVGFSCLSTLAIVLYQHSILKQQRRLGKSSVYGFRSWTLQRAWIFSFVFWLLLFSAFFPSVSVASVAGSVTMSVVLGSTFVAVYDSQLFLTYTMTRLLSGCSSEQRYQTALLLKNAFTGLPGLLEGKAAALELSDGAVGAERLLSIEHPCPQREVAPEGWQQGHAYLEQSLRSDNHYLLSSLSAHKDAPLLNQSLSAGVEISAFKAYVEGLKEQAQRRYGYDRFGLSPELAPTLLAALDFSEGHSRIAIEGAVGTELPLLEEMLLSRLGIESVVVTDLTDSTERALLANTCMELASVTSPTVHVLRGAEVLREDEQEHIFESLDLLPASCVSIVVSDSEPGSAAFISRLRSAAIERPFAYLPIASLRLRPIDITLQLIDFAIQEAEAKGRALNRIESSALVEALSRQWRGNSVALKQAVSQSMDALLGGSLWKLASVEGEDLSPSRVAE